MDFPSRRSRKQTNSRWTICSLLLAFIIPLCLGFIVYVAIFTGNYMGLAASSVLILFLLIGLNVGNIRRFMPGLTSEKKEIKYSAIFLYTCLGFMSLTIASHLPNANKLLPFESSEIDIPQQKPVASQDEKISVTFTTDNQSNDRISRENDEEMNILPSAQQEHKSEQTAPVTKMDPASNSMVVTKIIDAQLIQINNQQLVRLIGIQVPDSMQKEATALISELLKNKQVSLSICTERPKDDQDRTRAVVIVDGINVNQTLIENGYSPLVVTSPCSIDLTSWQNIENKAKKGKRGIWAKHPQ
jgi:endonuclease YncB( thermonuclease family)